jgi:predicted GNAT family acetyltransferase
VTTAHPTQLEVRHSSESSRYELWEDGSMLGIADYRPGEAGVLVFPHTQIAPDRRGEGLGAVLVRGALDDVRARGFRVVPACWYVEEFMRANPAYADLAVG